MFRHLLALILVIVLIAAVMPAQARGVTGVTNTDTVMVLSGLQGGTVPLAEGTPLDLLAYYPAQGVRPARWYACTVLAYPPTCGFVPAVDVDVY